MGGRGWEQHLMRDVTHHVTYPQLDRHTLFDPVAGF